MPRRGGSHVPEDRGLPPQKAPGRGELEQVREHGIQSSRAEQRVGTEDGGPQDQTSQMVSLGGYRGASEAAAGCESCPQYDLVQATEPQGLSFPYVRRAG